MKDFRQLLISKTKQIEEQWVDAVRHDRQISSDDDLPYIAVRDHLPQVLQAMASVLSDDDQDDMQSAIEASLIHGILRAKQGFDPAEIAREYLLLRRTIFAVLEKYLLQASSAEVIRAFHLIDVVIDEAVARCFKSYTQERLRELEQLQSRLTLNNQELTRLIRDSQDNISYLAHELKNPLNSIIGYSELFLRRQQNPQIKDTFANLEHIERVLANGRHLLRLINDSLEISRYESGKMKLRSARVEVRSLIANVVEVLKPMAQAKKLEMIVECDRAPTAVTTDALRLQQVLTNLISNAIRYTESGSVRVNCQTLAAEQWQIAVIDTGIGISPADQNQIFEPYYRASSNTQPQLPDSTGLGLAIVYRLVKLLQGRIELTSQVGEGSNFTVILPLAVINDEL